MEIKNVWILKLMLMWIISTIECNTVDRSKRNIQNESSNAEFFRDIVIPITHMELGEDKRTRRSSNFDRGYAEFLRNYHNDDIDRRGKYQVKESDERDSGESSSTSDDEDDDGESESVESEENRKKHKTKSNGRNKNKKGEKTAPKKKSKHCKTEKRGNMLCNICYNPKDDEKSESCAYNSDPSENNKNYEYSEDTSYSTKDKKPENFESDSNENEESDESDENDGKKKRPPINKNPVQNNRHQPQNGPRFQHQPPPHVHRPYLNPSQNYGPQTFLPQNFQPISLRPTGNSRPIRIQINSSPPPVALIRYRTVESPFGNHHIRLITYPSGPPSSYPPQNRHQNRPPPPQPPQSPSSQYYKNRRPTAAAQEFRPPRDINGAHSESLVSNVTKEHPFKNLPNHSYNGANREYATSTGKDWSGCRHEKTMENNQVCFECYVDGERRKECMYANANRPENFHKSKKSNTHHPYTFDLPIATVSKHSKFNKQKTKSHSNGNTKSKDYSVKQFDGGSNGDERFNVDLKSNKVQSNNSNDWNVQNNGKHERPQAQPVHSSVSDIIYGKARPGPEPLALFFQTDPTIFDTISNSNTSNNNTKIDLNSKTTTNGTQST